MRILDCGLRIGVARDAPGHLQIHNPKSRIRNPMVPSRPLARSRQHRMIAVEVRDVVEVTMREDRTTAIRMAV